MLFDERWLEEEADADLLLDADQCRLRKLIKDRLRLSLLGVVNSDSLLGSIEDEWWFFLLRLLRDLDRRYVRSMSLSSSKLLRSFSSSSSSSLSFSLHEKLSNA